jgi:hypothetical protein
MGSPAALPGLIHGLRLTYLQASDVRHEEDAAGLRKLNTPEADQALEKWYTRI